MISIHQDRLKNTINLFKDEIDNRITIVNEKLCELLEENSFKLKNETYTLTKEQRLYVIHLKQKLKKLVYADTHALIEYKAFFDKIICSSKRKKDNFSKFKDRLITLLGYEILRSGNQTTEAFYPKFFKELGIKVCVYCNSQLTVATEQSDKTITALFQVDHFIDKASHPCFAISFFNLYPVCASCNNKKRDKEILFELYSKDSGRIKTSEYTFILDKVSLAEFRLSRNEEQLKITFEDHGHGLNEHLAVQGIYDTQKDLAAEIIVKAEIYNQSYKEGLQKSFSKLYGKNGIANIDFNRFIIGNYVEPRDIHKRPMAKFTQDIARQLKLIPK